MKTKLLLFVLFSMFIGKAQNVTIPDVNFKASLVANTAINTNKDTEIQVSEANVFTGEITCSSNNISDLTGIEAFKKLTRLSCYNNQITQINLSQNTDLKSLQCGFNKLTTIDLSKNPSLQTLDCVNNELTSINLSKNIALIDLDLQFNKLTNLDVSKNIALKILTCQVNQLTSINLKNGNNAAMLYMYANYNPNLNCIQVDNVDNANSYEILGHWGKDATASYSTDCFLATSDQSKEKISIFPNPTKGIFNFSVKANVVLYNFLGQKVASQMEQTSLDVSKLPIGVYFIVLSDKNGNEILRNKVIKN